MLVSHSHKFIYINAYKVGGTSTEMALQPACQPADFPVEHGCQMQVTANGIVGARQRTDPANRPRFFNHMNAQDIKAELSPKIWDSYVKVANIRNPFTRLLSAVFMESRMAGVKLSDMPSARAAVESYVANPDNSGYKSFLYADGQNVLDLGVRFECIDDDTRAVAAILNLPDVSMVHVKEARDLRKRRPLARFFTKTAVSHVRDKEAAYFERFGYSHDPEEAHLAPEPVRLQKASPAGAIASNAEAAGAMGQNDA